MDNEKGKRSAEFLRRTAAARVLAETVAVALLVVGAALVCKDEIAAGLALAAAGVAALVCSALLLKKNEIESDKMPALSDEADDDGKKEEI